MEVFPLLADLGKYGVMGLPSEIAFAQAIVQQPALAPAQIAHVPVEHGQRRRGVFDEEPQLSALLFQLHFGLLAPGDVQGDAAHADRLAIGPPLAPTQALDPAIAAIGPHYPIIGDEIMPFRQGRLNRALGPFPIVGVEHRQKMRVTGFHPLGQGEMLPASG